MTSSPREVIFTEVGKIEIKDIASVGLQGFDEAKTALNNLDKNALTKENQNQEVSVVDSNEGQSQLAGDRDDNSASETDSAAANSNNATDMLTEEDKRAGAPSLKSPIEIPVNVSEL